MQSTNVAAGVCSACKYDPGCIYETSSAGVILQCEQFELAFPAQGGSETRTRGGAFRYGAPDRKEPAGLCSNCENRFTCIYPKPEGGVWHCEEYA